MAYPLDDGGVDDHLLAPLELGRRTDEAARGTKILAGGNQLARRPLHCDIHVELNAQKLAAVELEGIERDQRVGETRVEERVVRGFLERKTPAAAPPIELAEFLGNG